MIWVHLCILTATKNFVFILGKGPTDGLDNITLMVEKEDPVNFTKQKKKFCLKLHYNRSNSYIFVNGVEIHRFKSRLRN